MEDADFREKLTPEQYRVMREKGTEVPHTGKYWDSDEAGMYLCAACGNIIFLSLNKFDADDGFPAFSRPVSKKTVVLAPEGKRAEVSCAKCASHLGYKLSEKHFQINSIGLDFQEMPDIDWDSGDDNSQSQDQKQTPSNVPSAKTISFTIAGLTVGFVVGGSAMYAATPAPMCTPSTNPSTNTAQTQQPISPTAPSTVTPPKSSSTGITRPPVNPSQLESQGATTPTAPQIATTSSAGSPAGSASADGTASDGTAGGIQP